MISTPYHIGIRRSLRAFPTTPLRNLFAESGLPTIKDRVNDCTYRLLPKFVSSSNIYLAKDFNNALNRKTRPRTLSVIFRCLILFKQLDMPPYSKFHQTEAHPAWAIKNTSFAIRTMQLSKEKTSRDEYRKIFAFERDKLLNLGWNLLFTDGSKNSFSTSFAVTKENGELIKHGLLHPICSVFTAELAALYEAAKYTKQNKGKYVICTDSRSCIDAIESPTNTQQEIVAIRNMLQTSLNRLKFMWIPGHMGIRGNENADAAAKSVANVPSFFHRHLTKQDIISEISRRRNSTLLDDWKLYTHHYASVNHQRIKPTFPPISPLKMLKPFIRLRLGHTILTHSHLLNHSTPNKCPKCHGQLSLEHILSSCPNIQMPFSTAFGCSSPLDLLKEPSSNNIKTMYNYLKSNDLLRQI